MRPTYAAKLKRLLPPNTPILLITLDYPQDEMPGPPFSVTHREIDVLFGEAFDIRHCTELDVLAENPRFRTRGLTRLLEQVYLLRPTA
jgi:thiopurine S-methyltransferase